MPVCPVCSLLRSTLTHRHFINSKADVKIHIGRETTRGLGAGADPAVGQASAEESRDEIKKALEGADMVFVTVVPVAALDRALAMLSRAWRVNWHTLGVGVATKPFSFEGRSVVPMPNGLSHSLVAKSIHSSLSPTTVCFRQLTGVRHCSRRLRLLMMCCPRCPGHL